MPTQNQNMHRAVQEQKPDKGFPTRSEAHESFRAFIARATTERSRSYGFTLIEMVVSVALFSVVMTIASAAFLTLLSIDHKARATNDIVTNLSFALDSMSRSIRTGSKYGCGSQNGGDCASGGTALWFLDANGCYQVYGVGASSQIVNTTYTGTVACIATSNVPITDPRIKVTSLTFYVKGTGAGTADDTQPRIIISIHGTLTADSKTPPVDFSIETSATQRAIDL